MEPAVKTGQGSLQQLWLAAANGEPAGLPGALLMFALTPLEWLYRAGLKVYLRMERVGLRRRRVLPARVVSVGNLTLGGTGKTGIVETLARKLNEETPVAVLLRGYGGTHSSDALTVSNREQVLEGWQKAGDEAALLARRLPGVAVVAGKDRRKTGALAISELGSKLLLLDDGLQYWQLKRDVDIILVDARLPFGNGRVLPAGLMREPLSALRRGHAIVLTHTNEVTHDTLSLLRDTIRCIAPGRPVFHAFYRAGAILAGESEEPAAALKGKDVVVLCGIGSPESFEATLREEGARVAEALRFGDHHPFRQDDLDLAEERRKETGAQWVLTTGKDFVRMADLRVPDSFRVLRAEMVVTEFEALLDLARGEQG